MQCHWVNSSWCYEGLQHSSWTAWCWRWRHCDLSKFSELVTHWHIVALQKARIWTEYLDHLHTDNSNCFGICYSRTDESIRDVIVWFYHRTAVRCLVIWGQFSLINFISLCHNCTYRGEHYFLLLREEYKDVCFLQVFRYTQIDRQRFFFYWIQMM